MLFSWFYYSTQKRKKYISKHQSTEDFKASCSENILKFVGKHQSLSLHLWLADFRIEVWAFQNTCFWFSKQFESATHKKPAEAYLGLCCTSMMELFAEIVNGL